MYQARECWLQKTILVSDIIREVLAGSGYTVIGEARNGRQAIELAQILQPVILMDLKMPEVDGFEAARQIQGNRSAPHLVTTLQRGNALPLVARRAVSGTRGSSNINYSQFLSITLSTIFCRC